MATLEIRTPEGVTLRAELAGAGSRFAAAAIDGLSFLILYLVTMVVLGVAASSDIGFGDFAFRAWMAGSVLGYVIATIVAHALGGGRSPGKRWMKLRVVTADGYPAGWLPLTLRSILLPIDALVPLPIPGMIGLATIALTERRQRLGDFVAGTLVLSEVKLPASPEPFPGESWTQLEPKTLSLSPGLAARLSAEDHGFLRDLLTRRGLGDRHRRELFVGAARHYAKRLELGDFQDARVFLKELYLFLREHRA